MSIMLLFISMALGIIVALFLIDLLKKPIVGYTYACFDIFHKGHALHLVNCKKHCDKLIVGVLTDQAVMERKPKPSMPFEERKFVAEHVKEIDEAVAQEEYSPLPNVKKIKPDILFESTSHKPEDIAEAEKVMAELGGKVMVMPYHKEQSSTAIKEKIKKTWKKQ